MKRIAILVSFLLASAAVLAQTAQVKGRILDSKTREVLPFANVFINNTTIGTAADANGDFLLKNVPYGISELVFSYVGYNSGQRTVTINKEFIDIGTFSMVQLEQELQEVEVKGERDKKWERQLKQFEKTFLGDDEMAEVCEILNPWVVDFIDEKGSGTLIAKAQQPIEIKNMALGYKIDFHLEDFKTNKLGYLIAGKVRFQELEAKDEAQLAEWNKNRQNSYLRSSRHLFKSILDKRIKSDGFYLYTDNPKTKENTSVRSPYFNTELGLKVIPFDTAGIVKPDDQPNIYQIAMKGRVEIHYHGERAKVRTYRDIAYPVSWLEVAKNTVKVNREGNPLNPADLVISGDMNADRVARMLPLNYDPPASGSTVEEPEEVIVNRLQEKVYIQTDKPYYYPGEEVWLKGYLNYGDNALRDSLSRVLYVELINKEKHVVHSIILPIEHGFAQGNFTMPDTLRSENYALRAYTNWMRNFGEASLFTKALPVFSLYEKPAVDQSARASWVGGQVAIQPDKNTYHTREKINLNFEVKDKMGRPLGAHLSVSVVDASQVEPIAENHSITKDYPFKSGYIDVKENPDYLVEDGFGFKGQFLNDQNEPERVTLTLIEWRSQNMMIAETDKEGIFNLAGLTFFDSAAFTFHAKLSRIMSENQRYEYGKAQAGNMPYGKVVVKERNKPAVQSLEDVSYKIIKTPSPQRIIFNEPTRNVTMLSEVDVKGKVISDAPKSRPYGKADYVVNAKDLKLDNNTNLVNSILGKFPGLSIDPKDGLLKATRSNGLTVNASQGVLVTVDDVPRSGEAREVLSIINPSTIESIELATGINVLYGGQGVNGILSIYTKKGVGSDSDKDKSKQAPNLHMVVVPGYTRADQFNSPDYSKPVSDSNTDFRSTLYWNPDLQTDSENGTTSASFYAADLQTQYRIRVEGITEKNIPVAGEYLIDIKNN